MRHGETFLTQILRYPFGKRSVLKGNNLLPFRVEPFSVGICVQASKREVTKVKMMEVFQVFQSFRWNCDTESHFLRFCFLNPDYAPLYYVYHFELRFCLSF